MSKQRRCRVCGCTQERACVGDDGNCWWVDRDLCSACATPTQITVAKLDYSIKEMRAELTLVPTHELIASTEIAAIIIRLQAARVIVLHCAKWQAEQVEQAA